MLSPVVEELPDLMLFQEIARSIGLINLVLEMECRCQIWFSVCLYRLETLWECSLDQEYMPINKVGLTRGVIAHCKSELSRD